ncbi:hypothetical protein VTO42DRAFT_7469 [Malbranchea cinnamomea]
MSNLAPGALTSHHVNYLIWRYLQESGHGEAAVMLQRAWNPDPQNLPFAPHIKTHALVTLIQKGLQYHELEQLIDREGNPATSPPVPFFGESTVETGSLSAADKQVRQKEGDVAEEEVATSPKSAAQTDGDVDQTATLKSDKPIEGDDSIAAPNADESYMDIDKPEKFEEPVEPPPAGATSPFSELPIVDAEGDTGMIEQPPIGELPSPVFTLSTGQSKGVQIDPAKAADLTPDTTVVDIPGLDHVTKASWRPNDPLTLVAAGDTFCGLWKLSGQRSSVAPAHHDLVENTIVTAFDWDETGHMLAVATYEDYLGAIRTFNLQGDVISMLPDVPQLVSGLRWLKRGLRMCLVLSDGQRSGLTVWDPEVHLDGFPRPQNVDGPIYDISWSDDGRLFACGDGSVYECQIDDTIELLRRFSSEDAQEQWTFLKTAPLSRHPVAIVASTSGANIWVPTHDIAVRSAHHGDITAIDIRPLPPLELEKNFSLTLATSSMDDTVKLWNINLDAKEIYCTHRLFLGESCPALCSVFSPDGYAIAAVSQHKLYIWHADRGGTPLATWTVLENQQLKGEPSRDESPNIMSSEVSALDRTLSWDTDGKKLAFGFGQKIAIINLQR